MARAQGDGFSWVSPVSGNPQQSPYLGLDTYQEEHAPLFCGRETEIRTGLELLNRGAPNLVMVMGASGSGKSSLVRAGMLPRLRREAEQWLIVDPFRPGQDPFTELAESLALAFRRYVALDADHPLMDWQSIRDRLSTAPQPTQDIGQTTAVEIASADERLQRLLAQLEELRQSPPDSADVSLVNFLNWTVQDLHRICGQAPTAALSPIESDQPLVAFATQLRRLSERRHARVLLVIDQFEELLADAQTQPAAHQFLTLLRTALERDQSPLMVLGTMRSDFLGVFQRDPMLLGLDFESLSVGPMAIDGMRRVIEEPAKLGAISLETGLADRILVDTATPEALPLLSFTLWVLWRDYHEDGLLANSEYEAMGGLHGALSREADVLLAAAQREDQAEALRQAFVRMARLSETGAYVRQPIAWDATEIQSVHALLNRFIERRLLSIRMEGDTKLIEVTHEALFRTWDPLTTWLDEQRSDLLLIQQIHHDAQAWEQQQHPQDALWRGGRLLQAEPFLRGQRLTGGRSRLHSSGPAPTTTTAVDALGDCGFGFDCVNRMFGHCRLPTLASLAAGN